MEKLVWGDPPEDGVDIGTIPVPKILTNEADSEIRGQIDAFGTFGTSLPDWARVRFAIRKTRNCEKPYKCQIPGLGELLVGKDGWKLRRNDD